MLHHPGNTVPKWFLEVIGVYTSMLNRCHYCIEHHYAGVERLLGAHARARAIREALESGDWATQLEPRESAALDYARKLTEHAADMTDADVRALRDAGWEDAEILEINQVTAYFGYANRTVLGLGINTDGDILGLSPSDASDMDNWQHR